MATKPKPRKAATKAKATKPKTAAKPKAAKPKAKPKHRVVVLEQHGAGFLGKISPMLGAIGL